MLIQFLCFQECVPHLVHESRRPDATALSGPEHCNACTPTRLTELQAAGYYEAPGRILAMLSGYWRTAPHCAAFRSLRRCSPTYLRHVADSQIGTNCQWRARKRIGLHMKHDSRPLWRKYTPRYLCVVYSV